MELSETKDIHQKPPPAKDGGSGAFQAPSPTATFGQQRSNNNSSYVPSRQAGTSMPMMQQQGVGASPLGGSVGSGTVSPSYHQNINAGSSPSYGNNFPQQPMPQQQQHMAAGRMPGTFPFQSGAGGGATVMIPNGGGNQPLNNAGSSGQPGSSQAPSGNYQNLFVSGLPQFVTDDILLSVFAGFGQIKSAKVMLDTTTGATRGFGFVLFESQQEGCRAYGTLHNQITKLEDGREFRIHAAPSQHDGKAAAVESSVIYVRNLPSSVSEERVQNYFSGLGTVVGCSVRTDTGTNVFRLATVEFKTIAQAKEAIAKTHNNKNMFPECGERPVLAKFADSSQVKHDRSQKKEQQWQHRWGGAAPPVPPPFALGSTPTGGNGMIGATPPNVLGAPIGGVALSSPSSALGGSIGGPYATPPPPMVGMVVNNQQGVQQQHPMQVPPPPPPLMVMGASHPGQHQFPQQPQLLASSQVLASSQLGGSLVLASPQVGASLGSSLPMLVASSPSAFQNTNDAMAFIGPQPMQQQGGMMQPVVLGASQTNTVNNIMPMPTTPAAVTAAAIPPPPPVAAVAAAPSTPQMEATRQHLPDYVPLPLEPRAGFQQILFQGVLGLAPDGRLYPIRVEQCSYMPTVPGGAPVFAPPSASAGRTTASNVSEYTDPASLSQAIPTSNSLAASPAAGDINVNTNDGGGGGGGDVAGSYPQLGGSVHGPVGSAVVHHTAQVSAADCGPTQEAMEQILTDLGTPSLGSGVGGDVDVET